MEDEMNFRIETKRAIKEAGKKTREVMFVGSIDGRYRITWEEFLNRSNFEYDGGFGSPKIAKDLIVYFNDNSYMIREEYDGSEWWKYNKPLIFNETDKYQKYNCLCIEQAEQKGYDVSCGWETLARLNGERQ
jgi:hypothetical protein